MPRPSEPPNTDAGVQSVGDVVVDGHGSVVGGVVVEVVVVVEEVVVVVAGVPVGRPASRVWVAPR